MISSYIFISYLLEFGFEEDVGWRGVVMGWSCLIDGVFGVVVVLGFGVLLFVVKLLILCYLPSLPSFKF